MAKITFSTLLVALTLTGALLAPATAQIRLETIQYKNGRMVTGEIIAVKKNKIVLARKLAKGSIREQIPFDRIEPSSLYTNLVSALRPLDRSAHKRIADAAYAASLFATAKRHYLKSAINSKVPSPVLAERIAQCEAKDIEKILARSTNELMKEHFKMSRRLALLAMKRYPTHPKSKTIPAQLTRINRRLESARKRDVALARTRKEKSNWEAAEKLLAKLDGMIIKAQNYEVKSLRSSSKLRRVRGYVELGLRELVRADKDLWRLRQSKLIPGDLKGRLNAIDEQVITMQIRLRLHVASMYSIRGSFGNALSWANEALSFDPTDKSALAARARIETSAAAASSRGGGGFFH